MKNRYTSLLKIATILTLVAIPCTGVQAQHSNTDIVVTKQTVEKKNDSTVSVNFRADIGRRVATNSKSVVFVPVLTNGTYKWSLPAIVVQSRRAEVAETRKDWAAGTAALQPALNDNAILSGNKNSITYTTEAPWQLWMDGADLVAEILTMGCCSYSRVDEVLLYGNLQLPPALTKEPMIAAGDTSTRKLTTGEELARRYPFILPASRLQRMSTSQLFEEDRENSLTVNFRKGSHFVDYNFSDNNTTLEELLTCVRAIERSPDSKIKAILIGGFTSPEGSFVTNDRLAFNRAVATKRYILDRSSLSDRDILLHNGAEDWRGLRMLVAKSDMPWKEDVLNIIDNVPVWDTQRQIGRQGELMRLHGGAPYKYVYENFFPKLRNSAYIRVYYENK